MEKKMRVDGCGEVTDYFPARLKWTVSIMVRRVGDDCGHKSIMTVYAPTLSEAVKVAVHNVYSGSTKQIIGVYPYNVALIYDTELISVNL